MCTEELKIPSTKTILPLPLLLALPMVVPRLLLLLSPPLAWDRRRSLRAVRQPLTMVSLPTLLPRDTSPFKGFGLCIQLAMSLCRTLALSMTCLSCSISYRPMTLSRPETSGVIGPLCDYRRHTNHRPSETCRQPHLPVTATQFLHAMSAVPSSLTLYLSTPPLKLSPFGSRQSQILKPKVQRWSL